MLAIFVDLENELQELAREVRLLQASIDEHISAKPLLTTHMAWLHIAGLASGIEKIYTGCERIMTSIATRIDQSPVAHDQGWHATLLRRMHNSFPEIRDAFLRDDTYQALNDLRSFRHRERNSYGVDLDEEIVEQRTFEAIDAFRLLERDFQDFRRKFAFGAT